MRRISAGAISLVLALSVLVPAATTSAVAPTSINMFKEQVASQTMIGALMFLPSSHNSWVSTISFGHVTRTATKAVVVVKVHTRGGSGIPGRLVLRKSAGKWYFYSITRGTSEGGISNVPMPGGISTSVVGHAITEQRNHQWMLTGIMNGGYKKLTVLSRHVNVGTRQLNIRLSGGSRHSVLGRVVAYRKTASSGKKYWFISTLK